jgi:hypothetical protein
MPVLSLSVCLCPSSFCLCPLSVRSFSVRLTSVFHLSLSVPSLSLSVLCQSVLCLSVSPSSFCLCPSSVSLSHRGLYKSFVVCPFSISSSNVSLFFLTSVHALPICPQAHRVPGPRDDLQIDQPEVRWPYAPSTIIQPWICKVKTHRDWRQYASSFGVAFHQHLALSISQNSSKHCVAVKSQTAYTLFTLFTCTCIRTLCILWTKM